MTSIRYLKGDIFDSKAQVIVNTVNCKGVMGKGLALAFKQKYPDMFTVYERECQTGKLRIGRPTIYQRSTPWILNFPTKNHWRFPSKLEYIEKGLVFLTNQYKKAGITSIAFPKLGAQNGQLSWDEVGPLMAKYLSQLDIDVCIYIAEEDREYQYNPREAKKIAEARLVNGFKSLADLERIEQIATISLTKINTFVQKYQMAELIDMPATEDILPQIAILQPENMNDMIL